MERFYLNFFSIVLFVFAYNTNYAQQAPFITNPLDGQTDLPISFQISATSLSTGNTPTDRDVIILELSDDMSFDSSDPDYQSGCCWFKTDDSPLNMLWTPSTLSVNTTYFLRARSFKHGPGPVISFTTIVGVTNTIDFPVDLQTDLAQKFEIDATFSGSGNTPTNPDLIYIEISQDGTFNPAAGSPDYQKSPTQTKTDDTSESFTWEIDDPLDLNTTYFARVFSNKLGGGPTISFTVGSTPIIEVTDPLNGATNISSNPRVSGFSRSTNNSPGSPDNIFLDVDTSTDFDTGSPDYQRGETWIKTNDDVLPVFFDLNTLKLNTTYYARIVSTKCGPSEIISFTTVSSVPLSVDFPTNGQTDLALKFPIEASFSGNGNSVSFPDQVSIELSKDISFNPAQGSPDYQISQTYLKTDDASQTEFWTFSEALDLTTTYYVRVNSAKYGFSSVVSFTTGDFDLVEITSPVDGDTDVSIDPTITGISRTVGNTPSSPDITFIELSNMLDFDPANPEYQRTSGSWNKTNDDLLNMVYNPSTLTDNTTYYTRVNSSKNGVSALVSFSTGPLIAPVLELVEGVSAQNDPVYVNVENYSLTCTNVSGADEYNWVFDIEGDFISPEFTTTSPTNILAVSTLDLNSGEGYFVRIQARDTGSGDETRLDNSTAFQYFNSLHPASIALYGNSIDRRSFKLWTDIVDNATDYVFQVSTDPAFTNIFENPDLPESQASWPGVSGVVFLGNRDWYDVTGFTPSANPILYKAFDFIANTTIGDTYYFRVRAANVNQDGYWGPVHQMLVDPPPLSIDIESVSHGTLGLDDLDVYFVFTHAPNFDLTSVDFQLALDSGFGSLVFDGNMLTNTRSLRLPSIDYNTTYYARVRAYASNFPGSPSDWSPTTMFTTQMDPFPANLNDDEISSRNQEESLLNDDFPTETAIYPNPFQTEVTLRLSKPAISVGVFSLEGKLIENLEQVRAGTLSMGKNLPKGIYILRVGFDDRMEIIKLIKE